MKNEKKKKKKEKDEIWVRGKVEQKGEEGDPPSPQPSDNHHQHGRKDLQKRDLAMMVAMLQVPRCESSHELK
ncbi:hypothetical protein M0802_004245 [Mischocyttarus mexicanus]|nr:hypothetical protein M0802_004245 [Mischocyttarus mexicanus]